MSLYFVMGTPTERAAISLSRMALMARPARELTRFRMTSSVIMTSTLAFGEIVKNVMNACYLGVDSHGLHFSLKDSASLNLEVDGKVLIVSRVLYLDEEIKLRFHGISYVCSYIRSGWHIREALKAVQLQED